MGNGAMSGSPTPAATVEQAPESKGKPPAERRSRFRIDDFGGRFGILILWGRTIVVFWLLRPDTFGAWANFQSIFGSQAVLLILALGLLLTLSVGELDLSITGVMTVSVVLVGY